MASKVAKNMRFLMVIGFTKDEGFSLVETLAAIVIIGITTTAVLFFINKFLSSSDFNARMEALILVQNEIQNTLTNHSLTDTSYANREGNLKLYRSVIDYQHYYEINFSVVLHNKTKLILIPVDIKK